MSRIKEERIVGAGDDGQDLLITTDTVSGEVIKSITVRPVEEELKERKAKPPRKQPEIEAPLISAEEMARFALKVREDTTGKQVKEIIKRMLAKAEENVLSGSYTHVLDNEEMHPTISKSIIKTLKELGYTVSKKETSEGMSIRISWKTTMKALKAKEKPSTRKVRSRQERTLTPEKEDLTFEFQEKKD